MWFRASELKHGRVAMLASVGYLAGAACVTFPGEIAKGVTFESVNANGVFSAWSNVPEQGKLQVCSSQSSMQHAAASKSSSAPLQQPQPQQQTSGAAAAAAARLLQLHTHHNHHRNLFSDALLFSCATLLRS